MGVHAVGTLDAIAAAVLIVREVLADAVDRLVSDVVRGRKAIRLLVVVGRDERTRDRLRRRCRRRYRASWPRVDGNKRLAWLATYVFLAKNDIELGPWDDDAYDLVVAVAAGAIDDVGEIAPVLASFAGRARA
jgi:hypothetical protein